MFSKQTKSLTWIITFFSLLLMAAPSAVTAEIVYKNIELTVLDADTGLPIEGAKVDYYRKKYPSDAEGHILLSLKIRDFGTYFYISADSYTPRRVMWRSPDPSDYPDRYTVKMRKGVTIGGIILDEHDTPIPGATVNITGTGSDMGDDRRTFHDKPFVWDEKVTTDANGRWSYDLFPADRDRASLHPSHPAYITPSHSRSCRDINALKQQTFELRMKKGQTLRGTVLDPMGKPVVNAIVFQGASRFGSDQPETRTDQNGAFAFAQVPTAEMVLTVVKPGWAPELVVVNPMAAKPLAIQLEEGHRVELTVVDPDGRPVVDAWVLPDSWRKKSPERVHSELYRSLADISRATHDAGALRYNKHTDQQGRFFWTWAPEDRVEFCVLKSGMISKREVSLSAAENKKTVTLYPALTIHGQVTDKDTGETIDQFNVLHAHGFKHDTGREMEAYDPKGEGSTEDRIPGFITTTPVQGRNGQYRISFDEEDELFWVKIEAQGYTSATSRPIAMNEGDVIIDFALERAK